MVKLLGVIALMCLIIGKLAHVYVYSEEQSTAFI